MADSGSFGPEVLSRRARLADALFGNAMSVEPIKSPWQGAAKMAQALLGGYIYNQDRQEQADANRQFAALLSGGGGAPAAPAQAPAAPVAPSAPSPTVPMSGG